MAKGKTLIDALASKPKPGKAKQFAWDRPIIKPTAEAGTTMQRLKTNSKVAKSKSHIQEEYDAFIKQRRGK